MIATRFDPQSFFRHTDHVALHVAASEVFGLLKRSIDLPPQWAALVRRSDGDFDMVPAGRSVEGRDADDVVFIRVTPVDVSVALENLLSRDGFACTVDVTIRVGVLPERSELVSFHRTVMGSRRVAQASGLATFLEPSIRGALATCFQSNDASNLVHSAADLAASPILDALKGPCFTAGLVIDRSPVVRINSPAFRDLQEVRQKAETTKAEHEAARQVEQALARSREERLDQVTSLLTRLKELSAASPDAELPELIRAFAERDRGRLYDALFASEAPSVKTRWIIVAAGDELLFYDPRGSGSPVRSVQLSNVVGPARSVQTAIAKDGGKKLLIGGSIGVSVFSIDRSEPASSWPIADDPRPRGGFNAVAMSGEHLFASHSELGLWHWNLHETSSGRKLFPSLTAGAKAVRDVQVGGDWGFASIDHRVIRFSVNSPTDAVPHRVYSGAVGAITSLSATESDVLAGTSEGDVLRWAAGSDSAPTRIHTGSGRPVESVKSLICGGVRRLFHTETSLFVYARVLDDSYVCRYEAGGQTIRRIEVAPDIIVALNELRDRLFCWEIGRPEKPFAAIQVAAQTGHSIQDIALFPA